MGRALRSQAPCKATLIHSRAVAAPVIARVSDAERPLGVRLVGLTLLALLAFASNSLLCRAAFALGEGDPAAFTAVRLAAGALTLFVIDRARVARGGERGSGGAGSWASAAALFVYAAAFSWAYVRLSTGTGALLLFGAVQLTMLFAGLAAGERLRGRQVVGLAAAFSGLVVLVWPGLAAPPFAGALPMLAAGIAWGIYSLRGRGASDPVAVTTGNFLRAAPLALCLWGGALAAGAARIPTNPESYLAAIVSGALASGLGYVVWYAALRGLTATRAAIVQLAVPLLAAAAGVVLLGEALSSRLLAASVLVLGGVALGVVERRPRI